MSGEKIVGKPKAHKELRASREEGRIKYCPVLMAFLRLCGTKIVNNLTKNNSNAIDRKKSALIKKKLFDLTVSFLEYKNS